MLEIDDEEGASEDEEFLKAIRKNKSKQLKRQEAKVKVKTDRPLGEKPEGSEAASHN